MNVLGPPGPERGAVSLMHVDLAVQLSTFEYAPSSTVSGGPTSLGSPSSPLTLDQAEPKLPLPFLLKSDSGNFPVVMGSKNRPTLDISDNQMVKSDPRVYSGFLWYHSSNIKSSP